MDAKRRRRLVQAALDPRGKWYGVAHPVNEPQSALGAREPATPAHDQPTWEPEPAQEREPRDWDEWDPA